MITYDRKPVCLSLISTDQQVCSFVETTAIAFQKSRNRFHLLLKAPSENEGAAENSRNPETTSCQEQDNAHLPISARQWWLEIAPNQVIMTVQGSGQLNYRHFWQKDAYGRTRYWLPNEPESFQHNQAIRLHNFTHSLILKGDPLPEQLRVEYELLAGNVQLGSYILNLEIQQ
jgi:hypothetical protein